MRYVPLLACLLAVCASAADWPQWRGPNRDGVSKETGLLKAWPKAGPKLLWKTDQAGGGLSGMAVVGGVVYTMGARGKATFGPKPKELVVGGIEEYALAFDDKGKELWATKIGLVHDWKGNQWSRGPNATPAVTGDHVVVQTSKGVVACLTKKGELVWKKDLVADLGGAVMTLAGGPEGLGWGYTGSPLIDGDKVVVAVGGKKGLLAALELKSGKVEWQSKDVTDEAAYGSPAVGTIDGVKQYLYGSEKAMYSFAAKDGSLLWKRDHKGPTEDAPTPSPVVLGNRVYYNFGYEPHAALIEVSGKGGKWTTKDVWASETIGSRQGGTVIVDGHIYGFHENARWMCQELETGKIVWGESGRQLLKAGTVIAADGKLFVVEEDMRKPGQATTYVSLLNASPDGMKVLSQFMLPGQSKTRKPSAKVWTHPSLSEGKLYVRDNELLYCYEVK